MSPALVFIHAVASNVFGAGWSMSAPVRYLSYAIDTTLLTAALMLIRIVHQFPFVNNWLTVKVLLLVVYIVLGSFALKRAKAKPVRLLFSVAAIAVFVFIVGVAHAHNPLGWFARI